MIIEPKIKKNDNDNNKNNKNNNNNYINDFELTTDIEAIKNKIIELDPSNILCIFITTSCFAPRAYDDIESLSLILKNIIYFMLLIMYMVFNVQKLLIY